jgi:psp operon transcriptional activator
VIERAVYRWPDFTEPIDELQFDPFESPWAPVQLAANENRPALSVDAAPPPAAEPGKAEPPLAEAYDPLRCADFRLAVAEYEKAILVAALEKCRWNQRAAATALSLTYDQLRHAMRRHQLQGG